MIAKLSLLLWLSMAIVPAAAGAACSVDSRAEIPLQVIGGAIVVPVQVNELTANLILDTGAQRSIVTQEAAQRLGLARDEWVGTTMRGIGGIDRRPNANPRSLSLGGVPLVRRTLNHDKSLVVGIIPHTRVGNLIIDGLLGRDFLSQFDLDLDLPDRRVTIYQVHDCAGRFLPWSGNYSAVPVTLAAEEALIVPVILDTVALRAMLDSGSGASLLAAPGMFRMGLQPSSLAGDPEDRLSGVGSRPVTTYRHRFRSLQVGSQTLASPAIWVAPIRLLPIVDMLLGADWLAGRRVWISYGTRQLFVAEH